MTKQEQKQNLKSTIKELNDDMFKFFTPEQEKQIIANFNGNSYQYLSDLIKSGKIDTTKDFNLFWKQVLLLTEDTTILNNRKGGHSKSRLQSNLKKIYLNKENNLGRGDIVKRNVDALIEADRLLICNDDDGPNFYIFNFMKNVYFLSHNIHTKNNQGKNLFTSYYATSVGKSVGDVSEYELNDAYKRFTNIMNDNITKNNQLKIKTIDETDLNSKLKTHQIAVDNNGKACIYDLITKKIEDDPDVIKEYLITTNVPLRKMPTHLNPKKSLAQYMYKDYDGDDEVMREAIENYKRFMSSLGNDTITDLDDNQQVVGSTSDKISDGGLQFLSFVADLYTTKQSKSAYLFSGESNSGKSTFLNEIMQMIFANKRKGVSLLSAKLTSNNSSFGFLSEAVCKNKVVGQDEVDKCDNLDWNQYYEILGNSEQSYQMKHFNPTTQRKQANLMFIMNNTPAILMREGAVTRFFEKNWVVGNGINSLLPSGMDKKLEKMKVKDKGGKEYIESSYIEGLLRERINDIKSLNNKFNLPFGKINLNKFNDIKDNILLTDQGIAFLNDVLFERQADLVKNNFEIKDKGLIKQYAEFQKDMASFLDSPDNKLPEWMQGYDQDYSAEDIPA